MSTERFTQLTNEHNRLALKCLQSHAHEVTCDGAAH